MAFQKTAEKLLDWCKPVSWKRWAEQLKQQLKALYLASQDRRVPLLAKVIVVIVVAYALSPLDLIPDFIPVIGYLDDLLLLPIGGWLAIRLIPAAIWQDCLERAEQLTIRLPKNRWMAAVILLIWLSLLAWLGLIIYQALTPS